MAHFILEYSNNLNQDDSTVQRLFDTLHKAALETELFPLKGLRSRAYCCQQFRLADGNPHHGFAHLEVKLGAGRSMTERKSAAALFFRVFCEHFEDQSANRGIALSFEMKELEPVLKYNQNNLQAHL